MSPRIVRRADLPLTPWKNGGGVTRELHVERDAQGNPLWRISMALVESSGPFSAYPDVTRVLAVVRGDPLRLTVDGAAHLLEPLQPFTFSGDAQSAGELTGAAIEDFNVMAWAGLTPSVQIAPADTLDLAGAQAAALLSGEAEVEGERLSYGDMLLLDGEEVHLTGGGQVAAVWVTQAE